MPLSKDMQKIRNRFISQYGEKKGESFFYAWLNKQGLDETKPFPKGFAFFKSFELKEEGEDVWVEGTISSNNFDLQKEMMSSNALRQMVEQIKNGSVKLGYEHTEYLGGRPNIVPIGKFVDAEIRESEDGTETVWTRAKINKHLPIFNQLRGSLKDGYLDAYSVEFLRNKIIDLPDGSMVTDDLSLMGAALTGRPVNPDAVIDNFMIKGFVWEAEPVLITDANEVGVVSDSLYTNVGTKVHNSDYRGSEAKMEDKKDKMEGMMAEGEQDDDEEKKKKKMMEDKMESKSEVLETPETKIEVKSEPIAVDFKNELAAEMKSLKEELKGFLKLNSPFLDAQAKFSQSPDLTESEVYNLYDREVFGRIEAKGGVVNKDDLDAMYFAAGKMHTFVEENGGLLRSMAPVNPMTSTRNLKPIGKSGGYVTGITDDGRPVVASWGQAWAYKSRPAIAFKAQLEHDTNKVTTGTTYYQASASVADVYNPVLAVHVNDQTKLWGVLRKVDASAYGDRYGVTAAYAHPAAASYDESATDDPSGTSLSLMKLQIPFLMYRGVPQVSGLALAAADSQGGVGDLFGLTVRRHMVGLLRQMNVDLFGTADGMTLGSACLGLQYLCDDSSNYATLYGRTRTSGNFTTLQGALLTAKSGSPRITFEDLRTSIRACEKTGAERSDLIIVCDQIQRDFILGGMDAQQRNLTEQARAGFVGLPTFDGIPIYSDDQCTDTILYVLDVRHTYIVIKKPVSMLEIKATGDFRKAMVNIYWNLFSEAPNHNAIITGLASS